MLPNKRVKINFCIWLEEGDEFDTNNFEDKKN